MTNQPNEFPSEESVDFKKEAEKIVAAKEVDAEARRIVESAD